ncbi:MAG: hypothetical protein A2808_02585 [Candidatus Moranbacteria bacterium RIFCSPHIGHO2_01_FULL_55_24]|nr:MAG: hypothetical protein A2808_02585 [Candidatus Moranbacteria bacterium RIFCSPHIGHO2_01_FULL_55_24]
MIEIFLDSHFQKILVAGLLLAAIAPMIGLYLVTRRYSLLVDALSHVGLLGIALALLFRIPMLIGAFATTFLASLGIERARTRWKTSTDALMALFLSGSLALSIIFLDIHEEGGHAHDREEHGGIESFLFGSIAEVTWLQIGVLALMLVVLGIAVYRYQKEYFMMALDEELAQVSGVSKGLFQFLFFFAVTAFITLALSMVGSLMIGALLVIPVLASMQLGKGFWKTFFIALLLSLSSTVLGLLLAQLFAFPSGAMIVLVTIGWLVLLVAWKELRRIM